MLKNTRNYPFVRDVIDQLEIGRTAFYRHFPPDRIREFRPRTASDDRPRPRRGCGPLCGSRTWDNFPGEFQVSAINQPRWRVQGALP